MKKFITILFLMQSLVFVGYAQEQETVKPTLDIEIMRRVDVMDIEGEIVKNVAVMMESFSPDIFNEHERVKVTIRDENGKKIWKKTFINSYLYIFSTGQIQVGLPNFDRLIIGKLDGQVIGLIREKEGVY